MFSQNQAPWAQQAGPGSHIQQGPRPRSGPQPWGQQQQMPPSGMQSNEQFPGFGNSRPGQQPWNGNQQMGNNTPSDQSPGQPWMSQNPGGPGPQQPQNFPPYYSQHQQQQQQQRQIPQQPTQQGQQQFPPQQPGQQQFPTQQQNMPSNDAPWGQPQQNQPWQQQVSPQQQQMPPQQQRQSMAGPKVKLCLAHAIFFLFFDFFLFKGKKPEIEVKKLLTYDGGSSRCCGKQLVLWYRAGWAQ